MKVTLVSKTAPVIPGVADAEDLIVYCARVSNPNNQLNMQTGAKLLKYCLDNKHWSPFEMADMTVEIETSRAIAHQILRHWSFRFQEFSQRYAVATAFEDVELRQQGAVSRQGGENICPDDFTISWDPEIPGVEPIQVSAKAAVADALALAKKTYDALVYAGVAKECARFVLPLCTQTRLYMKGSVRSWIHYLQQRCDPHAQKEHRLVAEAVLEIFKREFPITTGVVFEG